MQTEEYIYPNTKVLTGNCLHSRFQAEYTFQHPDRFFS